MTKDVGNGNDTQTQENQIIIFRPMGTRFILRTAVSPSKGRFDSAQGSRASWGLSWGGPGGNATTASGGTGRSLVENGKGSPKACSPLSPTYCKTCLAEMYMASLDHEAIRDAFDRRREKANSAKLETAAWISETVLKLPRMIASGQSPYQKALIE